jgi:hypothetical protein
MSDPFEDEYKQDEFDGSLSEQARREASQKTDWLQLTKGQIVRASFVYFHEVNKTAVEHALEDAKESGKTLTKEQLIEIGRNALETRAKELGKSVDALSPIERLNTSEMKLKRMWYHFDENVKYVISRLGKDGPEADLLWKKLPDPKLKYTTLMLIYPTDRAGNIDKDRLKDGWTVTPWRFHKGVFEDIWKINKSTEEDGSSIALKDVKLECKEQQFQNISPSTCGPALWQKSPTFKEMVLTKAMTMYSDKVLIPYPQLTTAQLRAKMGMGGSAPNGAGGSSSVGDSSSTTDFTDILDGV